MSTGVQAIETGLAVLDVLASAKRPMMLKDIAAAAKMHPAKVHRYLVSFQAMNYAEQDASGLYRLGISALKLGLACMEQIDALRLATQVLDELSAITGETVFAAIWGSQGPTIVQWRDSSHPVTVNVRPGSVLPLLLSATGRVFLAFSDKEMLEPFLKRELARRKAMPTDSFPCTVMHVQELIKTIQGEGVGRVFGDLLAGVTSVSAPVFDYSGKLVLAITTLGADQIFNADLDGEIVRRLKATANAFSKQLGYQMLPVDVEQS